MAPREPKDHKTAWRSLRSFGAIAFCLTYAPEARQVAIVISPHYRLPGFAISLLLPGLLAGCRTVPPPGAHTSRRGDEIVVAGQFFHTGTKIVLWMDPGGYDAYRVERRFAPFNKSDWKTSTQEVPDLDRPSRYGLRTRDLSEAEIERVRGGGWALPLLQRVVDQFVIHFDVCGVSRECFRILQDYRDLSVHFMLDLDGTIYQTLDLKE